MKAETGTCKIILKFNTGPRLFFMFSFELNVCGFFCVFFIFYKIHILLVKLVNRSSNGMSQ